MYIPASRELFTAARGGGATLNGTPIRCGTRRPAAARAGRHRVQLPVERRAQPGRVGSPRSSRESATSAGFGAAAPDLCYVAAGRLDVYFEQWLGPWDWAAGELIAREAGCRTGRFDGGPIAAGRACWRPTRRLFDQMVELAAQ